MLLLFDTTSYPSRIASILRLSYYPLFITMATPRDYVRAARWANDCSRYAAQVGDWRLVYQSHRAAAWAYEQVSSECYLLSLVSTLLHINITVNVRISNTSTLV